MNNPSEIKLNIGAGKTYIPGFINVDISDKADLSLDIGTTRLPFEDNSVDLIFSYHTLEHVPNYLYAISEIYRVLKHRGVLLMGLPYVTLTEYHLINPYHLHNFNEYSFDFFDPGRLRGSAAEMNAPLFTKMFHRYHYIGIFNLFVTPFRSWCRRHLFNVVRKIDFGLLAVKDVNDIPAVSRRDARILKRQFDECMRSRIPYERSGLSEGSHIVMRLAKRGRTWWRGQ